MFWQGADKLYRSTRSTLKRLRVLFEPLKDGPRTIHVSGSRQVRFEKPHRAGGQADKFDLVVVDEAHHIYKDQELRDSVEKIVQAAGSGCRDGPLRNCCRLVLPASRNKTAGPN